MDPDSDPDPDIFVFDLQDAKFSCLLLFEGKFIKFFKDKSQKVGINIILTIFAL
jgi:hypothetical protein